MRKTDPFTLMLDPIELKARLMGGDDESILKTASECEDEIKKNADCFYTFAKAEVKTDGSSVDLGFGSIESASLAKYLKGCDTAYVAAVSLGVGVDRLLRKASVTSASRLFITDAVASALVEALCDRVQSFLPDKTHLRYSPGYGDLPLSIQGSLLRYLNCKNITLTDSYLMVPTKSVTFITGVK